MAVLGAAAVEALAQYVIDVQAVGKRRRCTETKRGEEVEVGQAQIMERPASVVASRTHSLRNVCTGKDGITDRKPGSRTKSGGGTWAPSKVEGGEGVAEELSSEAGGAASGGRELE